MDIKPLKVLEEGVQLTGSSCSQPPGEEDAGDGAAARRGAGDAEAGEGEPAGAGGPAERRHPAAGGSAEPGQREQQRSAADDGQRLLQTNRYNLPADLNSTVQVLQCTSDLIHL